MEQLIGNLVQSLNLLGKELFIDLLKESENWQENFSREGAIRELQLSEVSLTEGNFGFDGIDPQSEPASRRIFGHLMAFYRKQNKQNWKAANCKQGGYSARHCRIGGFTATDCQEAGLVSSAKDCKEAGFTARHCREAGLAYSGKDCKEVGFTAKHCKEAGFTAKQCKEAGFTAKDCQEAGFTATECTEAGLLP
eukprot:TRINITY_DN25337_c0_g1_i1.p1 TRINITY_DN25337_c0_g1~~TRINITY_DN25337_c0_g1_i1.p1  ORF type:complete len:194 (-),score=53.26 TRINITY_DN25337_c0_g1_i1:81-662(-)